MKKKALTNDPSRLTTDDDGLNKFNLNLGQSGVQPDTFTGGVITPLASPSYEEVPMWTILPSYQLYESTFLKNINPTVEDLRYNPPTYEAASPVVTPTETQGVGSLNLSGPNNIDYFNTPSAIEVPVNTNDLPNTWENSILGNTHRMKRVNDISPGITSQVKVDIFVTDGPTVIGQPSKPIDISKYEYHQGDSIDGYILVENLSNERISFDMFSVVLEGKVSVLGDANDAKKPTVFFKFLNMFDYDASWSPVDTQTSLTKDPLDGTYLKFPNEKYFEPKVVYKKIFSFKLPDRLLDCSCEAHNLTRHSELFPSIGLARDQFMQEVRRLRQRNIRQTGKADFSLTPIKSNTLTKRKPQVQSSLYNERLKDLSFPDTAISYSIETRVIGKASNYKKHLPKADGPDEFIIIEECSCYLRIIPIDQINDQFNIDLEYEARLIYKNLVDRITEKINLGKELIKNESNDGLNAMTRNLSITKRRQLYVAKPFKKHELSTNTDDSYSITVVLKKKPTITSTAKLFGLCEISSPKLDYSIKYIPAFKFNSRPGNRKLTTKITLPINLIFNPSIELKNDKPPEIKSINCELIVFTYRSKKYPVPIEIFPELIFKNMPCNDNFENNVCQPFKKYFHELTGLAKKLNYEVLGVDNQLIMDIKALADLSCKYHNLKVDDLQVRSENGMSFWQYDANFSMNNHKGQYSKTIQLSMDLQNTLSKEISGSNEELQKGFFTLVPSFQSCILGRCYFLQIVVKLSNHDPINLKVPIKIKL